MATITNAAGKLGQALAMNGTSGTFLSVADNATLSARPNLSFTVACWVYVTATGTNMGFVGKGSAAVSSHNVEYMLWQSGSVWRFMVGSGTNEIVDLVASSGDEPVVLTDWLVRSRRRHPIYPGQ